MKLTEPSDQDIDFQEQKINDEALINFAKAVIVACEIVAIVGGIVMWISITH